MYRSNLRTPDLWRSAAALSGVCLAFAAVSAQAAQFSGSGALTTDYVFRGISQTQGDPAAQFGARTAAANGFYGQAWGSTVEFTGETGASSEIDYVVGWSGDVADDWAMDVNVTYFDYRSARVDLAYAELIGTLTWKRDYWLMVGYSPDVFATGEAGIYTALGAWFPVNDALRIEAGVGHYALDDAYDASYSHASLGGVWAFRAPFELRVTAHRTDADGEDLFPGAAGSRVEAALQANF